MRYCFAEASQAKLATRIKTQKDFMMSTLHVKGIEWNVMSVNGKTAYSHRSIRISCENGCYQTKNHLNQVIFQHKSPAICLEDASLRILDAYSQQYAPSWANTEEEEIPVIWEDAA